MDLPVQSQLEVARLGECRYSSPAEERGLIFVNDADGILVTPEARLLKTYFEAGKQPPLFEPAGPRRKIFFNTDETRCGIVTCGGLCPGLNDVIRSIVMTLHFVYGVSTIVGFRYGFAGLAASSEDPPMMLRPDNVDRIHDDGGTVLGSSRGSQDVSDMVDKLLGWKINILFVIGGDGALRGAHEIAEEIRQRQLRIAVVGVPKTIDNDLMWVDRTFGFLTAVEEAGPAISAAHAEAKGAKYGVGLVKLMGRYSGFIALRASLANPDVNFCLIPEAPFTLQGDGAFLPVLMERLRRRKHAVVVVAEGAGQELLKSEGVEERDKSGNVKLKDIGVYLKNEIKHHGGEHGMDISVKYIDPSYTIRSQPANSNDSAFCLVLGQNAVHAGMAGRTDMVVGRTSGYFTHIPIALATSQRKQVDPKGEDWLYLLQMTGQPSSMVGLWAD